MIIFPKNQSGFTLMETMVSTAIFIVFMAVASNFIIMGFQSTRFGYEQDEAVANARRFANTFNTELREATTGALGEYLIATATPQEIVFYSNIDSDPHSEKIKYYLDDITLRKTITSASGTPLDYYDDNSIDDEVTDYINNNNEPIFHYFDADNTEILNPNDNIQAIRFVKVIMKINVTPNVMPKDYIIQTGVQIRNLKHN